MCEYKDIISLENLLMSWEEFLCGKKNRQDVAEFTVHFMDNVCSLHQELKDKTYQHGPYHSFKINDPKPREIHKASVRDRLVHHAVHRKLYPHFDPQFIYDSYSCRIDKGTHRAVNRFRQFANIVSRNHTQTAWVLKGDIRKFFANIDHAILKNILSCSAPPDVDIFQLLWHMVDSFHTKNKPGVGLPIGNLTSQLFVNIYMNKFDQFVKRKLKIEHYIRYSDDFVILSHDRHFLESLIPVLAHFLEIELKLTLHPDKLFIKTVASGVDFLGWINFPHHRILRTSTKRRMLKKLKEAPPSDETLASYLGLLSHGDMFELSKIIESLAVPSELLDAA